MKTALKPPLRAGEDDVLRALVAIIATTRQHWSLPPDRRLEATPGADIAAESFSPKPYRRTATRR
jgi:hypothetical protein